MASTPLQQPIAFIGGGNMAGALIAGLLQSGRPAGSILVVEPDDRQRAKLALQYGVHARHAPEASLAAAALVVWAVKPQAFAEAAAPCAEFVNRALHLSVMAGVRTAAIEAATDAHRVVRAMPNTPALIGRGIAGLYATAQTSAEDRAAAEGVLASTGTTLWVPREADLDAVTALSGSGPAYVFYFIEANDAGRRRDGSVGRTGPAAGAANLRGRHRAGSAKYRRAGHAARARHLARRHHLRGADVAGQPTR